MNEYVLRKSPGWATSRSLPIVADGKSYGMENRLNRPEGNIRQEVVGEIGVRFHMTAHRCWSLDQAMPRDEQIVTAIFEITGWEPPHRAQRPSYIHRFWKKYVYEQRNRVETPSAVVIIDRTGLVELVRFAQRRDFYETAEWRTLRYERLKISQRRCACCGGIGGTAKRVGNGLVLIHVDHIKSRSRYPELCLTLSNTQCLCEDCNIGKGSIDETDWRTS